MIPYLVPIMVKLCEVLQLIDSKQLISDDPLWNRKA